MNLLDNISSNEEFLSMKAASMRIPISGAFELLPICNMNCKMCYVRMDPEEMKRKGKLLSVDQWIEIGKQARDAGMLYLLLTGGEPLLYKEFERLYFELCEMGIILVLNTNGTLINEYFADVLAKNRPRKVNISLYGGSDETYDRLCCNPNGFTQVIKGIHLLQKRGIPVKLNCSVTPYNYDDVHIIQDVANQLNVPLQFANYMFPPLKLRNKKVEQIDRLSPRKAAEVFIETLLYKKSNEEALEIIKERLMRYEKLAKNPLPYHESGFTCYATKNNFWVNWKGEMTACGMLNKPMKNILKSNFLEAWNSIGQEGDRLKIREECNNCIKRSICQFCTASVFAETGEYNEKPTYLCDLADATLEILQKLYKKYNK